MLKVLIADDEELIRKMIVKMIDWESKGLDCAGTAENGLQVLSMINELHPDIVITDIRMPGIDGLKMISEASKKAEAFGIRLDFVIISGYRNFDYAHQALSMGVRHYLLKPIDRTELSSTLDSILAERAKLEKTKTDAAQEEQKEIHKRNARQQFLNNILKNTGIRPLGTESGSEGALDFSGSFYQAFFVKIDWTEEGDVEDGLLEILKTLIEKEEENWSCDYVSSQVKSGIISVINYPPDTAAALPDRMETLFTKCRRETDKFAGYTVSIGVGSEKDEISKTRISIDEAIYAVKCRIRKGLGRIIFYKDLKYPQRDINSLLTANILAGNRKAIEALDTEAVNGDFQIFTENIRSDPRYSPVQLFELTERMTELIKETFKKNAIDEKIIDEFSEAADTVMDRSTTEGRLIQRFQDIVELYFRKILQQKRETGTAPVREARQYLSSHFRENPSLDEVADMVGMSPAYFSTIFKKELGIGFSEYLIQLRCEEAKRLMRTSRDSLALIAEQVGYQDAKYFSRIFWKTVGIKPSEYRKLYQ